MSAQAGPVSVGPDIVPHPAHHADAAGAVVLRDLLLTMGRELASLQDLAVDAQLVMSFALRQAALDPGQWSRVQSLDLITQRLEGLGVFSAALAVAVPETWTVDAAATVRDISLSALARRILSRTPEPAVDGDTIELF